MQALLSSFLPAFLMIVFILHPAVIVGNDLREVPSGPLQESDTLPDSVKPRWEWTCDNPSVKVLFFNRLMKSGTSTINGVLSQMAKAKHPRFKLVLKWTGVVLDERGIISILRKQRMLSKPMIYTSHFRYVDLPAHHGGGHQVAQYMNIFRDPVERYISWYFCSLDVLMAYLLVCLS